MIIYDLNLIVIIQKLLKSSFSYFSKTFHSFKNVFHIGHNIFTIYHYWCLRQITESYMKYWPVLINIFSIFNAKLLNKFFSCKKYFIIKITITFYRNYGAMLLNIIKFIFCKILDITKIVIKNKMIT